MNRQSPWIAFANGGGLRHPQPPRFLEPCERALVNVVPSRTLFGHLRFQVKHITLMRPFKTRPGGPNPPFLDRASLL